MNAPIGPGARVYLIDGSGYIFRAYHALPPLTRPSDGLPVGAVSGFCNMLWKFLSEMKQAEAPTHLAVIFDKSEQTFRKDIYPAYKANRSAPPDDLIPQFSLIRDATRAFGVACVEMAGYEADDLIATYAREAARAGAEVLIVSSDKDLMQLVEDGAIRLFDPMKQRPLGPAEVIEKFGVSPDKVIDVQALMGDSVDNIPGAPGIGQKTAAELITAFGSLEALLERAEEIKQPKRRATLTDPAIVDNILLSKTLVTLKDDVVVDDSLDSFAVKPFDPAPLLAFLEDMQFRTLIRRVREDGARERAPEEGPIRAAAAPRAVGVDPDAYQIIASLDALKAFLARAGDGDGVLSLEPLIEGPDAARSRLIGLAMALGPNDAAYVPLAHRTGEDLFGEGAHAPGQVLEADAWAALSPILTDRAILKVGHNIKAAILAAARQGLAVTPTDCVMCMSYALEGGLHGAHALEDIASRVLELPAPAPAQLMGSGKGRIAAGALPIAQAAPLMAQRADLILRAWGRLKPRLAQEGVLTAYETLERGLPTVLAAMELAGIQVNPEELSRLSGEFAQRMAALEDEAYGIAGRAFTLGSPKQLGDILFGEMGLAGGAKTKTGAWSTDASTLEDLAGQGHALPRVVLDWRQLAKLRSTYTEALRQAIDPATGRVHTTFQLAATTTGRLSSAEPNLQNIPIRTEEGRRIREAFVAAPGQVLVSADYSQIELRLLAHVGDVPQLKQAFNDGLDIHAMTASEMFGVPIQGMDPMIRRQAKAINFGIIYGISAFGLANNLGISRGEADAYIKRYFQRFPGIQDYMEETKAFARANGFVRTIFGRKCWIADIKAKAMNQRAFAERQAINAPLQGAAADIIRRAMVRVGSALLEAGLSAKMLLQVHDELVFEAPAAQAQATCALVRRVMEAATLPAVALSVPLTVEAKAGATWGKAH